MSGPLDQSVKSKFTGDDLKRLKDDAYDYRDGSRFMWIKGPKIKALLARLEAAENKAAVADLYMVDDGYCSGCQHVIPHKAGCPWLTADEDWREVAGK